MNGLKTYIVALLVAVLPFVSERIGLIDWNSLLTAWGVPGDLVVPAATAVSGIVMIGMRFITQITTVKTALYTEPPKD